MTTRSAGPGRFESPLRPVEMFVITVAPEYDDDKKEWKVKAIPVRNIWGVVSTGGEWVGGGHRSDESVKHRWRRENEDRVSTLWLPEWWRKATPSEEEAMESPPPLWVGDRIYASAIDETRHVTTNYRDRAVGLCLKEDHQGRGVETEVYAGIWNLGTQTWDYTCTTENTFKMIDWRNGVPYPDAGATALGQWRVSTDNGAILEPLEMDCASPGACCT